MECIICNENILEKDLIALSCCHIYHVDCVIKMIKMRYRKCPLCRTRIIWNVNQVKRHYDLYINN